MKLMRRGIALLLCLLLTCSAFSFTSFAKTDEDEDYSVSDVEFDVSDNRIYITWNVGESKCSYKVELFKSSSLTAKNRVGDVMSSSYSSAQVDVTQRILNKGSGTYYARVTCKKKAKGESDYEFAIGSETIASEDLSTIRENYKEEKNAAAKSSAAASSSGAATGLAGGPGTAKAGGAHWEALSDGQWAAVGADGKRLTGWYEMDGKWYYSGDDGVMRSSSWIKSASEEGVWFYVDASGAMLVNAVTPDGYTVDAEGKYRQ